MDESQSYLSVSTQPNIKYKPMPDPLAVYVPLDSLTEEIIDSIVSTVQQPEKKDWHHSTRTLLAFLLAIDNKVSEIEKNNDKKHKFDDQTVKNAAQVRRWLVEKDQSGDARKIHWNELRANYKKMASENDNGLAMHFNADKVEPYYELTIEGLHPDVIQSREYMARFRSHGWESNELKVYWNAKQLENLCPKHETNDEKIGEKDETKPEVNNAADDEAKNTKIEVAGETKDEEVNEVKHKEIEAASETKDEVETEIKEEGANEAKNKQIEAASEMKNEDIDEVKHENSSPHDPSDADVIRALRQHPVSKRNHDCKITYVNKGIEKAVFDAPEDAQLIVLNFANERSPGGGYLRHAWAQEEIILYNSDGYRSLLDLKYGRMGGGYAIPEFGTAYVRDIRFFDKKTDKIRKADMLVSACYCLSGSPQLYDNPTSQDEWITNNLAKFRAFIAAAVANTIGDGSNTYLLLGPIGTGAFANDVNEIGYVFRDVLSSKMMGSKGAIRKAFGNIWFVSTDKWKNDQFEQILREDDISEVD